MDTVDGGYGWVVCAASFMAHVVVLGSQYSIGVVLSSIIDEIGERALASFISSIALATMLFSGVFVGRIVGRVGPRVAVFCGALLTGTGMALASVSSSLPLLYLTFGLITGFGFALGFAPSVFVVNEWFSKRRALANGIAVAGSGVGTMVLPPVLEALIERFGWRGCLRFQAVGAAVLLACCAATYRSPRLEERRGVNDGARDGQDAGGGDPKRELTQPRPDDDGVRFAHHRAFVPFCISVALSAIGYFTPFVHLVKYMEDSGASRATGALAIALVGLASTAGRVVFGLLTDHPAVSAVRVFQLSVLVTGVTSALVPLLVGTPLIFGYSVLFGMFAGAFIALMPVFVAEEVGPAAVRRGMGIIYTIQTPSVLLGPPLAGALAEWTGSYAPSFVVSGMCMVCGCLVLTFVRPLSCGRRSAAAVHTAPPRGAAAAIEAASVGGRAVDIANTAACGSLDGGPVARSSPEPGKSDV